MSYIRARYIPPMGDIFDTIGTALQGAGAIASDPALGEVLLLVNQLKQINASKPSSGGGVGMADLVTPLRAFVFYEENPWVGPVAIAAILGLPFLLGYTFGKKRHAAPASAT